MRKSKVILAAVAAAAVLGYGGAVSANTIPNSTSFTDTLSPVTLVSFAFAPYGEQVTLTQSPEFQGGTPTIGAFLDTLNVGAGNFTQLVFCDDLANAIDPSNTNQNFFFTSLTDPTGANDYLSSLSLSNIQDIVGLVTDVVINPSFKSFSQQDLAAYQLAIWNLENGGAFNALTVKADDASGPGVLDGLANTLLGEAGGFYTNEFVGQNLIYVQLESPCDPSLVGQISFQATPFPGKANCQIQGQITVVQSGGQLNVPEPGTLALLGSGLIGLGAFRRRRRKTA